MIIRRYQTRSGHTAVVEEFKEDFLLGYIEADNKKYLTRWNKLGDNISGKDWDLMESEVEEGLYVIKGEKCPS